MTNADIYEKVTNELVETLQKGVVPWQRPWAVSGVPDQNAASGHVYRGINVILTAASRAAKGLSSPLWLTFKQAQELGGSVRKGSKGTTVIYWSILKRKKVVGGVEEDVTIPLLKYFTVFNAAQVDGLDEYFASKLPEPSTVTVDPVESAEALWQGWTDGPSLVFGGDRAFYARRDDRITLPERDAFHSAPEYYGTLFHEAIHATGHADRLKRLKSDGFASESYSEEELVAEVGANFLLTHAGIEDRPVQNSAAYLQSWLNALKADHKLIFRAAKQAEQAANWVLGVRPEEKGVAVAEDAGDAAAERQVA